MTDERRLELIYSASQIVNVASQIIEELTIDSSVKEVFDSDALSTIDGKLREILSLADEKRRQLRTLRRVF